jgi:hypothetical protein
MLFYSKKNVMGDLVNLRQARKRKQRDQKAKKAEENRVLHGRTRYERDLSAARNRAAEKHLDAHQRKQEDAGEDKSVGSGARDVTESMPSSSDAPKGVVSIIGNRKSDNDPV